MGQMTCVFLERDKMHMDMSKVIYLVFFFRKDGLLYSVEYLTPNGYSQFFFEGGEGNIIELDVIKAVIYVKRDGNYTCRNQ